MKRFGGSLKHLVLIVALLTLSAIGYTVTVNPASMVTADSANTPLTIPYRDDNGAFQMGALTATSITNTGSGTVSTLTVTGNGNACLKSGPLNVDCGTPSVTVTSSMTVTGAGGLGVTGGNVGIGTAAPGTKLEVSSGIVTIDGSGSGFRLFGQGNTFAKFDATSGNSGIILAQDGNITGYFYHLSGVAGTRIADKDGNDVAFFKDGGNVGIGTASPATKLHVSSGVITVDGSGAGVTLGNYVVGNSPRVLNVVGGVSIEAGATDAGFLMTDAAGNYTASVGYRSPNGYFDASGTLLHTLTYDASGNVGINQDESYTPATTVDVNGSFQAGSGVHKTTATASGYFIAPYWTKAQIAAATPATAELGGIVTCTDCASAYSVCQATGTVIMGFRLGLTGTTACQ